ncbi:MAG: hypothetical protein ACXWIP_28850 [Burkholderiales bacterium]
MHQDLLETPHGLGPLPCVGVSLGLGMNATCIGQCVVWLWRGTALIERQRAIIYCGFTGPLSVLALRTAVTRALVLVARQALCLALLRARVVLSRSFLHIARPPSWQVILPVQRPCP